MEDITQNIRADIKVIDMPLLATTLHRDLLGTYISDLILQVLAYVAFNSVGFIVCNTKITPAVNIVVDILLHYYNY